MSPKWRICYKRTKCYQCVEYVTREQGLSVTSVEYVTRGQGLNVTNVENMLQEN